MATSRIEQDSFGTTEVPAHRPSGKHTQRSIGQWAQPEEMFRPGAKRISPD
jgi:fumarate hydratase class II